MTAPIHPTVLITGASSGIGFELAQLFAKDKYKMIIVSRDREHLNNIAVKLSAEGAQDVIVIAKDLSAPGSAAELYREVKQQGHKVNVLVNDAGVGEYGLFNETDLDKELDIIQLNVTSLVHLTKLFLRDMVADGSGRIMELASVASFQPIPKMAVYAATKAFVLSFSDAIGQELEGTGVTVTALIPHATDTDFFRKANMLHTETAQNNPQDPAIVARVGYKALMNGERHANAPKSGEENQKHHEAPAGHTAAERKEQQHGRRHN